MQQEEKETTYIKKGKFYEYTCPYCGYIHKIDNDFMIYNELKKGGQVQDRCFNCNQVLYMEAEEKTSYKFKDVIKQGKEAVKEKYNSLTEWNNHGDAIRLICEYYDNKKAVAIMEHINALHEIYGHLSRALGELREQAWDMVREQYYKDFVSGDIFGQVIEV